MSMSINSSNISNLIGELSSCDEYEEKGEYALEPFKEAAAAADDDDDDDSFRHSGNFEENLYRRFLGCPDYRIKSICFQSRGNLTKRTGSTLRILVDIDENLQFDRVPESVKSEYREKDVLILPLAPCGTNFVDVLQPGDEIPDQELPKNEDFIDLFVSDVTNPCDFHVQLSSTSAALASMMNELEDFYSDRNLSLSINVLCQDLTGTLIACLYVNKDGVKEGWHRARILKILDDGRINVDYVDYGTREDVSVNRCRFLVRKFSELPIQALKAKLYGILPPDLRWPQNSSNRFHYIVSKCNALGGLVGQVRDNRSRLSLVIFDTVTNYLPEGINLNKLLIREGLARADKTSLIEDKEENHGGESNQEKVSRWLKDHSNSFEEFDIEDIIEPPPPDVCRRTEKIPSKQGHNEALLQELDIQKKQLCHLIEKNRVVSQNDYGLMFRKVNFEGKNLHVLTYKEKVLMASFDINFLVDLNIDVLVARERISVPYIRFKRKIVKSLFEDFGLADEAVYDDLITFYPLKELLDLLSQLSVDKTKLIKIRKFVQENT